MHLTSFVIFVSDTVWVNNVSRIRLSSTKTGPSNNLRGSCETHFLNIMCYALVRPILSTLFLLKPESVYNYRKRRLYSLTPVAHG